MLRDFCILSLLFLVVCINITLLPNEISKLDSISSIFSTSTIAYAQQQPQQAVNSSANSQVWIDKQSSTKVQFAYSPENPFVSGVTELKFNVEDSKESTQLTDVFAKVTIIGVLPKKTSS